MKFVYLYSVCYRTFANPIKGFDGRLHFGSTTQIIPRQHSCYNFSKGVDSMKSAYSPQEKEAVVKRYINGEAVSSIITQTGIPRSTVYAWIKTYQDKHCSKEISARNFRLLENKVKRLERIIEILQQVDCTVTSPLDLKLYALEQLYGQYSVHMLCDALQVPRGTFYNHILRNKRDNTWYAKRREEFREKIQQIYDDSKQIFGADKITAVMREEGYRVSRRWSENSCGIWAS